MNDKEFQEVNDMIVDRTLNVTYSFWNTLFTFHGIMIGAITITTAINNDVPRLNIFSIFFSGIIGMFCIIHNFYSYKSIFQE